MKRIPPPGSHPGGGPGPAGTPCTRRHHVARRTSSTIHIHPPRRSTPACAGRTVGGPRTHTHASGSRMAKGVSGRCRRGGVNAPDNRGKLANATSLTAESSAPSLGRAGGLSGPFSVRRRKWTSQAVHNYRWNFGSAKSTKHTGCLPTTRRSMIWHGSMVFEFSSLD